MDSKERLIKNILLKLSNFIPVQLMSMVKESLTVEFSEFEIETKCTDVSLRYTENESLLRKFIATKRLQGLSEKSLKRYYEQNLRFIQSVNKPLNKITTNDIRYYLSMRKRDSNLSNITLDGMRRCISTFFRFLCIEDYVSKDPCLSLGKIKCEKTIKKPYTVEEMTIIRKACKTNRDAALVEFLYSTGARVSEVSELKICDIDFEHKECVVHGKGNKERYVYLSDECLVKLHTYLDCVDIYSNDSLFGLTKNGIEQAIHRIGEKAGIISYPHKFRRTLATNLINLGMNIQEVAKILGHENITTTQIYSMVEQSRVKSHYEQCFNIN